MLARWLGLETIDLATLHRRLQAGGIAIFDVNARASWLEARIPGARPLDPETFLESDLPGDRADPIVFYCSHRFCRRAPRAVRRAQALGYRDMRVLSAGIAGWLAAGLPTESGG